MGHGLDREKAPLQMEYIDFKIQKKHRVRKNLLKNTAISQAINGVTFSK